MGKTEINMNKHVFLGQTILDLSKALIYQLHYGYMHPKNGTEVKLYYMDTSSFVYEIQTEDIYKDIAKDLETKFDTNRFSANGNRSLLIGKNKKVIGMMKDELVEKLLQSLLN